MINDKKKRISFDVHIAEHIYEMIAEHLCLKENCFICENINNRFKKFLGKKKVAYISKLLRKNGYCNKLKGKKL